MGGGSSAMSGRRATLAKSYSERMERDNNILVDAYAKGNYIENIGFLKADLYEVSVILSPSKEWVQEHEERLKLKLPAVETPVDIKHLVARKIAIMNWLNSDATITQHTQRYVMSMEDKIRTPMKVIACKKGGKPTEREVEVQILIKGDDEYHKCRTTWPEITKPTNGLIAHAVPNLKSQNEEAINFKDGASKPCGGIKDLTEEYGYPAAETPFDLQEQITQFYKLWFSSEAYPVFHSHLQKAVQQGHAGKLIQTKTAASIVPADESPVHPTQAQPQQ